LRGLYIWTVDGYQNFGGQQVTKALMIGIQFNGDGTFTIPFSTVNIGGNAFEANGGVGTYTVAADCTGTLQVTGGTSFKMYVGAGAAAFDHADWWRSWGRHGSRLGNGDTAAVISPVPLYSEVNFASTLLIPTISTGEIDNPGGRFRADSHIRFYAIHAIGLSLPLDSVTRRWRFALAAYGVTGLGVDYRSTTLDQPRFFDFGPAGKFPLAAGEYTNLTILKFTPALAYQVTPEFSLGLALHIDYA